MEGNRYKKALKLLLRAKQETATRMVKKEIVQEINSYLADNLVDPAQITVKAVERNQSWIQVDCSLCVKHCHSKREYLKHRKEDHPGVKFQCQFCVKQYASWNGVQTQENSSATLPVLWGMWMCIPIQTPAHQVSSNS